jgi:hypothetical protein
MSGVHPDQLVVVFVAHSCRGWSRGDARQRSEQFATGAAAQRENIMRDCRALMGTVSLLALGAAAVMVAAPAADARVSKIQITIAASPA